MSKNDSNELLNVLSIISLQMAKYNLSNNLDALKNDIENYNNIKLMEKHQKEEEQIKNQHLKTTNSKNMDDNHQQKFLRSYKRYNSSKLMKNVDIKNKNNYSPKKSCDMTKNKYQLNKMLEETREKDANLTLSPIKRTKRLDSRKSGILFPDISNNEQFNINANTNTNINKDINLENNKSNKSNNNSKISSIIKDNSKIDTISENDSDDSDSDSDDSVSSSDKTSENISKNINNNNLQNKKIENPKNIIKTYIKKLSSKFEDKKVSFHVEENIKRQRSNSRKNSILSEDVLKKNFNKVNNNSKINNNIISNNTNRISNLKNYKPNYQNNLNNSSNPIKRNSESNSNIKKKQKNSIESIKEKIPSITEEMVKKEKNKQSNNFKREYKKYKTLYSTITTPLVLKNVIKDEEFMDIINDNDDFSLSDKISSFTKENLGLDLFSQQKSSSYNNIEMTSSYDNYYSLKSSDILIQSSSYDSPQRKKNEKIIEESPNMKKYQISSSFAERQMKRLQIKNNNINKLRKKLEKKNNVMISPKMDSNSQKLINQKGNYIPLYKRAVKIQYDKNLKFNLILNMKKQAKIKNDKNKGFLSYRENGNNSNIKIVKFFESQISWKEKVNSKTKKLKNDLEKEKENSLNEELLFKPKILNNSEYKRKTKNKSIFMKLYHDQKVKERKMENLKKELTPSFMPNINNEKSLNYYNKKNINIFNNYSKSNCSNTSRLKNNISSNFEKSNKILYYEEEDSSATLSNRLKNYEIFEISKIKKDNIKNNEKDDTMTSLTGLDSDKTNNKFPNINESNSTFLGHGFFYPDSNNSIIYNQYNNIHNNYINYPNKSVIIKNKIIYQKDNKSNQKIGKINEIPNNPKESMGSTEIKSGKVKFFLNSDYDESKFEEFKDNINYKKTGEIKSEISGKEKRNNLIGEKDEQSIFFNLWNFNGKKRQTLDDRKEKYKKQKYNGHSWIMKKEKGK